MNRKLKPFLETILLHTAFDPEQFAQMPIEAPNSTERIPVDEGEYLALVEKYEFRPTQSKDGKTSYLFFDVLWNIDDEEQRKKLGRDKVLVRQSMSLERDERGALALGKGQNVEFGRLREALGLNVPGQPFVFSALIGQVGKVKVKQRTFKNASDEDEISAEVKGVTKA